MQGVFVPRFAYGLSAGSTDCTPMSDPDSHQDIELNLLDGESLTWLIGGKQVVLARDRFTMFWGAVPHQRLARKRVKSLSFIHIPLSWFLSWELSPAFIKAVLSGGMLVERDMKRSSIDRLSFAQWSDDIASRDSVRLGVALMEIRARLMRFQTQFASADVSRAGGGKLIAAARYIAEHYTDELYAEKIAEIAGVSADHIAGLFRTKFGTTIPEFINRHRVWHAQRLLMTTHQQVIDIALSSGFGSMSQFNEIFKKYCSMSPRDYRKRSNQAG